MTIEELNKIDKCRHLLSPPAPDVVGKLVHELRRYLPAPKKEHVWHGHKCSCGYDSKAHADCY